MLDIRGKSPSEAFQTNSVDACNPVGLVSYFGCCRHDNGLHWLRDLGRFGTTLTPLTKKFVTTKCCIIRARPVNSSVTFEINSNQHARQLLILPDEKKKSLLNALLWQSMICCVKYEIFCWRIFEGPNQTTAQRHPSACHRWAHTHKVSNVTSQLVAVEVNYVSCASVRID